MLINTSYSCYPDYYRVTEKPINGCFSVTEVKENYQIMFEMRRNTRGTVEIGGTTIQFQTRKGGPR